MVFEGGGEKKGNVGIVIGIVAMFGSGGRVSCGIVGMVGIVGIDGCCVGFGKDGNGIFVGKVGTFPLGNVGIVGKVGTFPWGNGIVGKGGKVGFGRFGIDGVVVCKRWRDARLLSMLEKEIAMKIAKMKEL